MRGRSKLFPILLIAAVVAIAAIATVAAMGGLSPGGSPTPSPTPTPTSTALPAAEDVFPNKFYPVMVVGDYVYEIGFELYNGSYNTVTIREVEFRDLHGKVQHAVTEEDIADMWGSGEVASGELFPPVASGIAFDTPRLESEVREWYADWYCIRIDGQDFVVQGEYEEF